MTPSPGRRRAIACIDFVELVTDYVEGTLPGKVRQQIDEHLMGCDGCDAYLSQMRLVRRATGRIELEAIPPDMFARLLNGFRASRSVAPGPEGQNQ